MELKLEKCDIHHLEKLLQISRETFCAAFAADNNPDDFRTYIQEAFSEKTLEKELRNMDSFFFFVYVGSTLVGYFKLNEGVAQNEFQNPNEVELERIYVLEKYQGKKIGLWMLNTIKKMCLQRGKTYVWLGVWEENKRAIAFYKKQGFTKIETHPYFVGKDKQTDWLMRFDLSILKIS